MKMQNDHVLNKILIFDNLVIGKHEMAHNRKELYVIEELQPPSNRKQSGASL